MIFAGASTGKKVEQKFEHEPAAGGGFKRSGFCKYADFYLKTTVCGKLYMLAVLRYI